MNKKRAEGLSINMIIIALLGFIVLVIVAVIFKTHVLDYSGKYKDTADKAIESAEGGCVQLFSMTKRKCSVTDPGDEWEPVEGKCDAGKGTCWEKKETSKTDTS